jgi:hypothetical protein
MNKKIISGLLTGMPMITCFLMGLFFLHNIFNKTPVIFNRTITIILCIILFFSTVCPFIFSKVFINYNEQKKE